jgi:hypothetical protein
MSLLPCPSYGRENQHRQDHRLALPWDLISPPQVPLEVRSSSTSIGGFRGLPEVLSSCIIGFPAGLKMIQGFCNLGSPFSARFVIRCQTVLEYGEQSPASSALA